MDPWPMVGRSEELAYLAEVIADPLQRGVVVAGRAGVGKTRLLREVVEAVRDCHLEVITATESARSLPFGAVAHLLPEDLETIERVDLLAVIGRHLARRAQGRSVVVAVDDMHLLDGFSAALVHHLATAQVATVLLTLRSGEAAPDALAALYRDGTVSRMELQAISRAEFDELIEGVVDGVTESFTLDRMWSVTEGNVPFARELVGDALAAGTLARVHGLWRWTGELGVAPRLRETVAARLGGLSAAERDFLEVLSVGEPLTVATVERLAPEVSLPSLERRNMIVVERTDHRMLVRLGHPLFGEALRAAMPASLHQRISHDLAETLAAAVDRQPGDTLRLALWRDAAGEPADPVLLAEAARNANTLSDHRLAERLARASLAEEGGFDAELELGRALFGQNRFEESEAVLTPLLGKEGSDVDRERLADTLSQAVGFGLGRIGAAVRVLESVEHDVTDPVVQRILQGQRATFLTFAAGFAEAAALGTAALDSVKDEAVRLRSLASVGGSLVMSGRTDEALALNNGALESALRLQDRLPRAPAWVLTSRCTALFFAGRGNEALALLDRTTGTIPNLPAHTVQTTNVYRGRLLLSQGRARRASRLLNDALVTLLDNPAIEPSWVLALAAEAEALLGQHEQARITATEAISYRRTEFLIFAVDELRALAWVDAQDGRISSAIDQLVAAADLAAARGQRVWEIMILGDLLRLGEQRVAERARQLAEKVDGAWSAAIAAHANGVLSSKPVDLETAAEAFAVMGSSLVAAELWATASAALQREGLPARAAQAARNSAKLAEICEGVRTPPLEWVAAPLPLSRREREIAMLAAGGATSSQIATELFISVRTVESHLYAAFAKLGITDRNQLPEVFQQQ